MAKRLECRLTSVTDPFYFCTATLVSEKGDRITTHDMNGILGGTAISSLHKLRDDTGQDSGFFIYGDLSVKIEGDFRLQFTLYEWGWDKASGRREVSLITDTVSDIFHVYPHKSWPGMDESTHLTRLFSDQGVRLRLRKEPRTRLNPLGPSSDHYQPRKYSARRRPSGLDSLPRTETSTPIMSPNSERIGQQPAESIGQQQLAHGGQNQRISSIVAESAGNLQQEMRRREGSVSSRQSPLSGIPHDGRAMKRSRTGDSDYQNHEEAPPFSTPPVNQQQRDRTYQQTFEQQQQFLPQFIDSQASHHYVISQPQPQVRHSLPYLQPFGEVQQPGFEAHSQRSQSVTTYGPPQYQRASDDMGYQYNMPTQQPYQQSFNLQEQESYPHGLGQPSTRTMTNIYSPSPGLYGGEEQVIDPTLAATSQMPPPPQSSQQPQQQFYTNLDPQLISGAGAAAGMPMGPVLAGMDYRAGSEQSYAPEGRVGSFGPDEGIGFRSAQYDMHHRQSQQSDAAGEIPQHLQG